MGRSAIRVVATLALGASLVGCARGSAPHPSASRLPTAVNVTTAPVLREAEGAAEFPAVLAARERSTLVSRLAATVVELPFREGQPVPAGAVLVRLDDGAPRAALQAAEAGHAAAAADARRMSALLQRGAATPRENEEAAARSSATASSVASARQALSVAVVRAPFAGTLTARLVHIGDVVTPGLPLVELEGHAGLELRASIDALAAPHARPGTTLQATVDGLAQPLAVVVDALSTAADPATQRFELRAKLPASPGLRSGAFARLSVPQPEGETLLSVPAQAVFERGGLTGVFVADAGFARLRFVAVGDRRNERVEVRSGLREGERVILAPGALVDGLPILTAER